MVELQFPFSPKQQKLFTSGKLINAWAKQYPFLFDKQDVEYAKSQPGYYFFEWLGAILIYLSTGDHSFIQKYDIKSHPRKHGLYQKLVKKAVYEHIMGDSSGIPDLFVYKDKHSFFCEVKGPHERLSPVQLRRFRKLKRLTGKDVLVLRFEPVD